MKCLTFSHLSNKDSNSSLPSSSSSLASLQSTSTNESHPILETNQLVIDHMKICESENESVLLINYSNMVDVANSSCALLADKDRELSLIKDQSSDNRSGIDIVNLKVSQALMTAYTALRVHVSEIDAYLCGEVEALEQLSIKSRSRHDDDGAGAEDDGENETSHQEDGERTRNKIRDVIRGACGMGQVDLLNKLIENETSNQTLHHHQKQKQQQEEEDRSYRFSPDLTTREGREELSRLLGVAAFNGHIGVIAVLLSLPGADVNVVGKDEPSAPQTKIERKRERMITGVLVFFKWLSSQSHT